MDVGREGGFEGESAAVDVEQHGELGLRVSDLGEENAGRHPGFGRDEDVLGSDPGERIVEGRDFAGLMEFLHPAVSVDSEESELVCYFASAAAAAAVAAAFSRRNRDGVGEGIETGKVQKCGVSVGWE